MDNQYNLVDALRVLIKWKRPIAIFVIVASIAAVVASLFLDNYYESKAVFYPTNPSRTDRQALFSKEGSLTASDFFGTKNDVNRFISIANSAPVVDFIVNYFNLTQHYGYDTTSSRFKRYKVTEEFKENYSVIKTEYGAIEISVIDTDPQMAADMVNMILEALDKFNKQNITDNRRQVLQMYGQTLKEKQEEVSLLTDSLAVLKSKYDIEETGSPGIDGGNYMVTASDHTIAELFRVLRSRQVNAIKDLNEVKTLYDQSMAVSDEDVSSLYMVEKAYASEKKAKPKRSILCLSAFFISLFLAVVGALFIDKFQQVKAQL